MAAGIPEPWAVRPPLALSSNTRQTANAKHQLVLSLAGCHMGNNALAIADAPCTQLVLACLQPILVLGGHPIRPSEEEEEVVGEEEEEDAPSPSRRLSGTTGRLAQRFDLVPQAVFHP